MIHFSPQEFLNNTQAHGQSSRIPVGLRRDEALFHEMVHSLRQMAGVMDCSAHPNGFDTKDEVWAILTTNIYCSAFRRPLRRNHEDFEVMTDEEVSGFYKKFESMIGRMCRELPVFTRNIARITYIKFNPFRDYYERRR
ncbi:hypothetical protein Pan44_28450 [Caulifigura coniformis]|uniref:Uncharacterized protein n=1 Tax=Caulifigura coniformis TaxID=2527983 RepID=A0A517SFC7_9PLAN|nr:hypothetical protein [Caulifigura coniformis]QDT54807.1 hypothetical protein Pan44_28450 [Caulifigura coniformis]